MKAAKKASSINEIARYHARVVQSNDELAAAEARHGAIKNEYGELLLQFVITTAHQAGLMRLSPAVIQAGIHYVAVAGTDPAVVVEWTATAEVADAVNSSTTRPTGRRPRHPGPGKVIVLVKITKREGERCVPSLRSSGIKWSGKHNHYRGIVDRSDVEALRTRFPNCVRMDGEGNQIDGSLGGGAVDVIPSADGDPLTASDPSLTNIEAVLAAGSDDPQSSVQPNAKSSEAGSDASNELARSNVADDIGIPQAAKSGSRPQIRPHGASPFNRLPTRPSSKES
jgi:hypothetical protein